MLTIFLIIYVLIGLGIASKYSNYCKNNSNVKFTTWQFFLLFWTWPTALGWLLYTLFIKYCVDEE
jgi:hypothetical protein